MIKNYATHRVLTPTPPSNLTQLAIKNLNDSQPQDIAKKLDLVLQILKIDDVQHNPEKKDSAKIKQKYVLSDGVCCVKAIISEQVLNK
jgi:hypothetical protein